MLSKRAANFLRLGYMVIIIILVSIAFSRAGEYSPILEAYDNLESVQTMDQYEIIEHMYGVGYIIEDVGLIVIRVAVEDSRNCRDVLQDYCNYGLSKIMEE